MDALARQLPNGTVLRIPVRPGDLLSIEEPIGELWPASVAEPCGRAVRAAVVVGNKRTVTHDAAFGLRQLADIAVRALSPSLNDPTTAVTCVGYLRTLLVRLAARELPSRARRFPDRSVTVIAERREFREFVQSLEETARNAKDEPRVWDAVNSALRGGGGHREKVRCVGPARGCCSRSPESR